MNKIKVIDLLNMISKGEEVPKRIKYQNYEYEFNKLDKEYQRWFNGLDYGLGEDRRLDIILNDEVEIIEEKKKTLEEKFEEYNKNKIPKKIYHCCMETNNEEIDFLIKNINDLADKYNELLDYLKNEEDE